MQLQKRVRLGDVLLVRGKLFKVKAVTGGGMPREVCGGADLIVFDRVFTFNARTVTGHRCIPVLLKAQKMSAGEPCACREKFGPRLIFKIFSLDQIRVDQEKGG